MCLLLNELSTKKYTHIDMYVVMLNKNLKHIDSIEK